MKITKEILNRKGARKAEDIPPKVTELLNAGLIETANLTEWLAADQLAILKTVLRDINQINWYEQFETTVNSQKKISANNNTRVIGQLFSDKIVNNDTLNYLKSHNSDVVRSWACWAESSRSQTTKKLLASIKSFAADKHFGVREVVIFASKEKLANDLKTAISILSEWADSKDENIRRYAIETIRPNGVWTKKIKELHEEPALGLPVLEKLKSDSSQYVQNAVANWLNDSSKSQPQWVVDLCDKWSEESNNENTKYIIKRALRTVNK